MFIDERQLRSLVERIVELALEAVGADEAKSESLLVLAGSDTDVLKSALRTLPKSHNSGFAIVVNEQHMQDEELGRLVCSHASRIMYASECLSNDFDYENVIYPVMPRDILAKCALCIPDTGEVKIFDRALSEGVGVVLKQGALMPFSEKEPDSYRNKILGYIRVLLEYGVEIELKS